jgi:hypothetical protein
MFRQGIKIVMIIFIVTFGFSCKRKSYNTKAMYQIRLKSMQKTQSILGLEGYLSLNKNLSDSIKLWIESDLELYKSLRELGEYRIDSIICINSNANKLRACILSRCLLESCSQDYIEYLNGVNIDNNWYFFHAPRLVLPREYYQRDIHKPLSWELMEQIAADHLYSSYLKSDGSINDQFFQDLTSVAWGPASNTQTQWDSTYLAIIRSNWEKKE